MPPKNGVGGSSSSVVHVDQADISCVSSVTGAPILEGDDDVLDQNLHVHDIETSVNDDAPSSEKLVFGKTLAGREQETKVLREAFDRISQSSDGSTEIVIVSGVSGVGKSALVEKSLRTYVAERGGYFGMGKSDQNEKSGPYYAMSSAFADITDLILQQCRGPNPESENPHGVHQDEELQAVRTRIVEVLREEQHILGAALVSSLATLLGVEEYCKLDNLTITHTQACARLKMLCKAFVRALATPQHPLVIILDDIQWSDKSSLEVMRALMMDPPSKNVLIVGIYRDDCPEATSNETFRELMSECRDLINKDECPNPCQFLPVECLSAPVLKETLASLMKLNTAKVTDLSGLIHRKTHGNPLFVLRYLELLQWEKLLSKKDTWTWDVDRIEVETNVTDNVASILEAKITKLPTQVQDILKLASCVGFSFDLRLFQHVALEEYNRTVKLNEEGDMSSAETAYKSAIRQAILIAHKKQLIGKSASNEIKFVHDSVQACLYRRMSMKERQELHMRIGRTLQRKLAAEFPHMNDGESEAHFFLIVDHLNKGIDSVGTNDPKRLECVSEVIRLNLEACERLANRCGFMVAAYHARKAVRLLETISDPWDTDYKLALETWEGKALYESYAGCLEEYSKAVVEVLEHAKCFDDRLKAYLVQFKTFYCEKMFQKGLEVGQMALLELKVGFPSRPNIGHFSADTVKTRRILKGKTDDDIVSLPAMANEKMDSAMKVLAHVCNFAFILEDRVRFSLATLRMIQLTFKCGVHPLSAFSFSAYGMLQSTFGRQDEAFRFGELSLKLAKSVCDKHGASGNVMFVYSYTHHWGRPLAKSLVHMYRACKDGYKWGEIHYGSEAARNLIVGALCTGKSLEGLDIQADTSCKKMVQYFDEITYNKTLPHHQCILNLLGDAFDPVVLTGEVMDEKDFFVQMQGEGNTSALANLSQAKLRLACLFGSWDAAIIEAEKTLPDSYEVHFSILEHTFFKGLAFMLSGKRKHQRLSKQAIKKIEHWLSDGKPDCQPYLDLLRAEESIYSKSRGKVQLNLFDKAIASAKEAGFTHMEAFANECAAIELMAQKTPCCPSSVAARYLNAAQQLYHKWGARAKVEQVKKVIEYLVTGDLNSALKFSSATDRSTVSGLLP